MQGLFSRQSPDETTGGGDQDDEAEASQLDDEAEASQLVGYIISAPNEGQSQDPGFAGAALVA